MMTNDEVVLNLNKQKTFKASMCFGLPHPSQSFLLFHYLATEAEGQNSSWFKKGEIFWLPKLDWEITRVLRKLINLQQNIKER